MAVYNMDKIKLWYDDFNSCKSSYLNNHYQAYKSSYVVNNGDPATNKMQEKLDTYYSRLKKAYFKVGTQWKNLYSDLMNADAALAGQKSSGSLNSSGASAKISAMPKLLEYKNSLQISALTKAAVASMVTGANISTQGMSDLAVESNGSSNSSNISEMTATGAVLGATIASIVPGLGTAVGAVLGAATGALVGSGIVSKFKDWLVGTGQTIKETAINVKDKVSSIVNSVKNTEGTLDKIKVIGSGAKQIGKKFAATGATIATSAVEGIYKLLEDAVDLVALAGAAVASVGTGTVDLVNAAKAKVSGDSSFKSNYTKQMWEKTRSFVSTDFVGNVFDSFYEDTPAGQWIKNNSIGFDTTRAITKEVSEVIGVVALSTVTGGGAAVMYGAAKVAEHTESNWQDENTSTAKGLLKGTLQGVADGAFFAIGAKGDAALKTAAEATSKTALKSAGIEVAENASKKALQESLKGLSKESVKVLGKDLSKMLAKKTAFECATSVAQDLGTIGIDTILSNDTVTDTNGNIIKLNSLSEKWNYYYEQAGGVQGLAQSMLTAGVLSGLSDTVDTTQLLKGAKQVQRQANKVAFKSAASTVKDDILDSVTKVKNKLDNSTIKQKVSDSISDIKSKLHNDGLKTGYRLDQLKASANIKLVNGGIALSGKTTDLGTTIKNFTGESLSRVKNKLDNSTVKQKVSDSISNTKSKISDIGSNIKEYASDKVKNVNLKLKSSLSNTKFKLAAGITSLTGKAINLKNKLKSSVDDIVNKINSRKQVKGEAEIEIKNFDENSINDFKNIDAANKSGVQQRIEKIKSKISNVAFSNNASLNNDIKVYSEVFERMKQIFGEEDAIMRMKSALNGKSSYITRKDGLRELFDSISDDNKFIILQLETNPNLVYNGKTIVNFGSKSIVFLDVHQLYDKKNDIIINIQENYKASNNQYGLTANNVMEALEKIFNKNNVLLEKVKELNITDIRNPDDSYWAIQNNVKDFTSSATGGNGIINIYKYSSPDSIENTLAHEIGHSMDVYNNVHNGISDAIGWAEAVKNDGGFGITSYAEQSRNRTSGKYAEDFAESIALLYKNGGNWFTQNYPNRANILRLFYPSLF